ncbi:MAG: preprotein translocase subunit SecY [Clostridiales bacterium]|nr:preprotein translocase subunit SecY [Clostridiales bacterium]
MLEILRNAWKIQELRKKILYTLLMLFIYRIGSFVPVPGISHAHLSSAIAGNSLLYMLDMFNGGALSNYTLFAAGITPYITASIVFQLLTMAIPRLEALQKEGEEGRKKIAQYTRYAGIVMALIQAVGILLTLGPTAVTSTAWYNYATIGIVLAAGTAICMWIGERITENGIGNGISLLIFINIVAKMSSTIFLGIKGIIDDPSLVWVVPVTLVGALIIIVAIVFVDMGQRRIPVQYAKRVVGRKLYGGQSTHIPLKVNNAGVMPIIFAMTIVSFPGMLISMFFSTSRFGQAYAQAMANGSLLYGIITALFIIFFTYFYSTVSFNPIEISKNIQQNGGFIPGIRPGKTTSDYLARISSRITLFAALFFAVLATIPMIITAQTGANPMGATSVIILVGVALETSKQLESHLLMRHYKGFLK